MAEAFNHYHQWLGIPIKDQPPTHYRLLGIDQFESDSNVIEAAADRQMTHVRTYQVGQHSALSQKLLNELAAARVCLLNPDKKAEYDDELRGRLSAGSEPAKSYAVPIPVTGIPVSAKPFATVQHNTHTHRKRQPWPVYAALGAGALLLAVLLTSMMSNPDSDGGIDTTEIVSAQSKNIGTPEPPKPEQKPEPPLDRSDPPDVLGPQVPPSTPATNDLQPSSLQPAIEPVTPETPTEENEPVGPSNVDEVPTIPSPPPDAEDQLKNALDEAKSPQAFSEVAKLALQYVDQAIVSGDGETAKTIITWAVAAAREAKDDELSKTSTLRYLEVRVPLTEEVLEGARTRLATWKPPPLERNLATTPSVTPAPESVSQLKEVLSPTNPTDQELRRILTASEWLRTAKTNAHCYVFAFRPDGTCEGRWNENQSAWKTWKLTAGKLYIEGDPLPDPLHYDVTTEQFATDDGEWHLRIIPPGMPTDDHLKRLLLAGKWRWVGANGQFTFTFKDNGMFIAPDFPSRSTHWWIYRTVLSIGYGQAVAASLQYNPEQKQFVGVQGGEVVLSPIEE